MAKGSNKKKTSAVYDAVYEAVRQIPKGKVTGYGIIGHMADVNPRVVGYALHSNSDSKLTPCHRVVFKDGTLTTGYVFGGEEAQRKILTKEGVKFDSEGKVNIDCFWSPFP
jgi:methylated-DNA-protein-cysteine methyltransferase-like protein